MSRQTPTAVSGLRVAHAIWGGLLLVAPDRVSPAGVGPRAVERATRLLGARHLAEAALLARRGTGTSARWTVAIDLLHATSMLGIAFSSRRARREALISAAVAGLMATWAELERGAG